VLVYGVSTEIEGASLRAVSADRREITFELPGLPLLSGEYAVNLFLFDAKGIHLYERWEGAGRFSVSSGGREVGLCRLPHRWR